MSISTTSTTKLQNRKPSIRHSRPIARYLVHYDGSQVSAAALRYACTTAQPGTKVIALYLPIVPQTESLDLESSARNLEGKIILAGAVANARACGHEITTQTLPCRVKGPALVARACDLDAHIFLGVELNPSSKLADPLVDYVSALAPSGVTLVEV